MSGQSVQRKAIYLYSLVYYELAAPFSETTDLSVSTGDWGGTCERGEYVISTR